MKFTRIATVLVALLMSAALIAACGGGDDKEEYAQQVEDVLTPLGSTLTSLGTDVSSSTDPKQLADGIGQAEDAIQGSIDDLEAITPPEGVESVQEDLISALQDFSDELTTVREAAEKGDLAELQKAALNLPQAAADFQTKLTDIQNAAIDAGVPIEDPSGG
jgi:hypothetical protein